MIPAPSFPATMPSIAPNGDNEIKGGAAQPNGPALPAEPARQ